MAKHCDPACNKPAYKETVKTYERCAVVDCAYTEVIVTETQNKDGVVTTTLTDKAGNPLPPETKFFECKDPVNAIVCQPDVAPPEPITLEGQDCDGAPVSVTGMPGQLVSVVQAKDTVFKVQLCEGDSDFELSCGIDPATDHTIQTAYKIVNGEFVLIKRWDVVTGAEWTGDPSTLEGCGGTKLESEQELFCDNGVQFLRWYILKDGKPTGDYVDTDFSGAVYTVTDPAAITKGECVFCTPTISSAFADDIGSLLPGNSISIQKPSCCAIKVTTSAGEFLVRKGMMAYSTADFNCPVTVTAVEVVSGTCDVAEIIVTTQKLG